MDAKYWAKQFFLWGLNHILLVTIFILLVLIFTRSRAVEAVIQTPEL